MVPQSDKVEDECLEAAVVAKLSAWVTRFLGMRVSDGGSSGGGSSSNFWLLEAEMPLKSITPTAAPDSGLAALLMSL